MFNLYDNFFFGTMSGKKYSTKDQLIKKNWTGRKIFYNLLDYVISRFKWDLPDTCDSRFLELCLICDGYAIISKPKTMPSGLDASDFDGIMNFKMLNNSSFSMYGYPVSSTIADAMGRTYGTVKLSTPNSTNGAEAILLMNSKYNMAPIQRIKWYADRLVELESAISAAVLNTKASVIVRCTPEQKNSVLRSFQEAVDGAPIIITIDKGFDQGADYELVFNQINTDVIKTLYEMRDKTYADFFQEFGMSANGIVNKMSGVSTTEIMQSAESVSNRLNADLDIRKKACEQVKELFGIDISVDLAFDKLETPDNTNDDEEVNDDELG